MTTTADQKKPSSPPYTSQDYQSRYKVVGTRPIRHDGIEKVTGRAKYGADVHPPGLLHGKVLRSPHAHARVLSIDAAEALDLPGVEAVLTAEDVPILEREIDLGNVFANPQIVAANMLAKGKVLYQGHAIAAVAATSPHLAEEALKKIRVEYEVLPPLLDVREAMKPGAPQIHESMTTRNVKERFSRGDDTGVRSNIGSHLQFKRGDVQAGLAEADVVVEREWETAPVHQGYIEPHASTAFWAPDGKITVWTSTQGHFSVRGLTATILDVPEHHVKVIPQEIGGGFGGKTSTYIDPVCALLSKKTGHPVKIVMSRREVFEGTGPTSGSHMRAKIGAKKTGEITAIELYMAFEAGAFPGSPIGSGAITSLAPYKTENLQCDAYDVIVNKQKVGAYRAPGSPQGAVAIETVIDELAAKLGMDALDFRLKNAAREGDRLPSGVRFPPIGCVEVEEAMRSHPHYKAPLGGPNRGRGIAMGYWGNAGMPSSVTLSVNSSGTVGCVTGSVDIGGTRPAISMQVAEVLGLPAEDMVPSVADTDSVGWTGVTGGSRTAFSTGIAAISAAEDIRGQMTERAARTWEVKPEDVAFEGGVFTNSKNPDERLTFKQLAARMLGTGGPVTASATSSPTQIGAAFCGNIVDVEVDLETGKVEILRFTVVEDVGQAAHPSYAEGQMQGGTVQGIGWALNEEYFFSDDGRMMNPSFLDYRMPTSLDLPMIDTVLVEVPNPGHPYGLRGVGEVSLVPPMAAIANAIHAAVGVRMDRLPMSPGTVLEALDAEGNGAG